MSRRSPQTERLVDVIEYLTAGAPPVTLAEVSRHLGLDKATCYPMMNELVRVGWLIRHPSRKTYQLGPRLVAVGRAAEGALDIVDFASPVLARLADATGRATCVIVPSGGDLSTGAVVQPRGGRVGTLGIRPGDFSAFAPPTGAVLVAWGSGDVIERWIGRRNREVHSEDSPQYYDAVLQAVRSRGFTVEQFRPDPESLGALADRYLEGLDGRPRTDVFEAVQRGYLSESSALGEIDEHHHYFPYAVSAPVFDESANTVAALCVITDVAEGMSGRELTGIGRGARDAARELTRLVGGVEPRGPA